MARAVRWNEDNLKENDETRCATMTIDEPPTPFNFEYCEDEEDEEDEEAPEAHEIPPSGTLAEAPPTVKIEASAGGTAQGLSFADQWERAGLDQALSDPSNLRPSFEDMTEEEREAARIAFEKNRKKHYEMGQALKARPSKDEDDEDDNDDEAAQGAAGNQ